MACKRAGKDDIRRWQVIYPALNSAKEFQCQLYLDAPGITFKTRLNMSLLDARSQTYSAAICAQLRGGSLHTSFFHSQNTNPRATKASYRDIHTQRYLDLTQIATFAESENHENGVLVIENVDLNWCVALGVAFGIDHTFFTDHVSNPPGDTPWEAVIGDWSGDRREPSQNGRMSISSTNQDDAAEGFRDRWHVDGVLMYESAGNRQHSQTELTSTNFMHRPTSYSKDRGWSAGTRISYILAKPNLCRS
jgi:hypothetical protein